MAQFVIHNRSVAYCNLCDLGRGYLTHRVTWLIEHMITWFFLKALSLPLPGQWLPILANFDLNWVGHNHPVTWLIYHVITLYSQKGASSVPQRQWPSNLVGLWVRVKGPHLLFQVTCRSSDCMLFEKRPVSANASPQNSGGDIKHRKTDKLNVFFVIQKILRFDSYRYTPL